MKRKLIVALLVLLVAAVSTIVVRADLYSNRRAPAEPQSTVSNLAAFSSVLSSFINTREESSYLIVEGGVFLILGFFWLRRARRADARPTAASQ